MATYQKLSEIAKKYIPQHLIFKHGFNLSPMYRRSTGRIIAVTKDLMEVRIKIPISFKNRNYVGSIFGGSMFSAVDPVPMVQLINLLGPEYVVWDKSARIYFKRPAREHLFATFSYAKDELTEIHERVVRENEIEIVKKTDLTSADGSKIFCQIEKTLYITSKSFYRAKRAKHKSNNLN